MFGTDICPSRDIPVYLKTPNVVLSYRQFKVTNTSLICKTSDLSAESDVTIDCLIKPYCGTFRTMVIRFGWQMPPSGQFRVRAAELDFITPKALKLFCPLEMSANVHIITNRFCPKRTSNYYCLVVPGTQLHVEILSTQTSSRWRRERIAGNLHPIKATTRQRNNEDNRDNCATSWQTFAKALFPSWFRERP